MEKLHEIRTMIEHLDPKLSCYVISDHIINLLPLLEGHVNTDKQKMLDYIDTFLALPERQQREFQISRRMWTNHDYTEMNLIPDQYMQKIRDLVDQTPAGEEWEKLLRQYLRNYI